MNPAAPSGPVVLNQKYELGRQLGAGGMGTVYWARHLVLQRQVAVKVLTPELMNSEMAVERFLREARALAAVDHPGVCHIFDADTDPVGVPFLVMELLEGETLDKKLKSAPQTPIETRVKWIIEAANGLSAAHARGIVHRDVKPSNLMLTSAGAVKVLDFGVAKAAFDRNKNLTGENAVGTAQYMSPEQLMAEEVDQRSDVWSLAVTLYKLLSGKLPFEGATAVVYMQSVLSGSVITLGERGAQVPPAIWKVLERALRSKSSRTPTIKQFADELSDALLDEKTEEQAPARPPPRKSRAGLMAGLVGAGALAAVAVWFFVLRPPSIETPPRVEPVVAPVEPPKPAPVAEVPKNDPPPAPIAAEAPIAAVPEPVKTPKPVVRPKPAPKKPVETQPKPTEAQNPDRL